MIGKFKNFIAYLMLIPVVSFIVMLRTQEVNYSYYVEIILKLSSLPFLFLLMAFYLTIDFVQKESTLVGSLLAIFGVLVSLLLSIVSAALLFY